MKSWWQTPTRRTQGERFGLAVALVTALMAALALYRGQEARMEVLSLVSASLLAVALVLPDLLFPPAWLLEKLFTLSIKMVLYVMLIIIFYFVFSPVGIMIRLLGKDPLQQKLDPAASSYWLERKPRDPKSAERQF